MAHVQFLALSFLALSLPAFADWVQQSSGTNQNLSALHFLNADTGLVVGGDGTILKTTDGGATWTPRASGTTTHLRGMDFADKRLGYAVGGHLLLRTTNGGESWDSLSWPAPTRQGQTSYELQSISTPASGIVYAAGSTTTRVTALETRIQGFLTKSTDSGKTWTTSLIEYPGAALQFASPNHGLVAGYYVSSNTMGSNQGVQKSTDGGGSWTLQGTLFFVGGNFSTSLYFPDTTVGYAAGYTSAGRGVQKTTDGGATWKAAFVLDSTETVKPDTVVALTGFGSDRLWVVAGRNRILRTTDGGIAWTVVAQNLPSGCCTMQFVNAQTGWAVGASGLILKTNTGGTGVVVGIRSAGRVAGSPWSVSLDGNVLRYSLPRPGLARLTVYNHRGATLTNTSVEAEAGENHFDISSLRLTTGVYFVRLESGSAVFTHRLARF